MINGRFLFEPLRKDHDRRTFSCGEGSLDRYLAEQAGQDLKRRASAVFVLVDVLKGCRIVGFYTLSAASITLECIPDPLQKKFPRYPDVPVTRLGRLAIDLEYQGMKLGELLLIDAISRAYEGSRQVGSTAVVVDAKHEKACSFYEHYGFIHFADDHLHLFLPMMSIEQLLHT